jgi:hypothetical protein
VRPIARVHAPDRTCRDAPNRTIGLRLFARAYPRASWVRLIARLVVGYRIESKGLGENPAILATPRKALELESRMADWQKLFPKLERKKTWFMVQKDLERIGIPYESEEGIADFHAAGRHSHITELLRNGTTLPEAKELARPSDINMTMKYAHIGIVDQAKAVAKLPAPRNGALHGRCISGGVRCHSPSSAGKTDEPEKSQNPAVTGVLALNVATSQTVAKWRRRESNPSPVLNQV